MALEFTKLCQVQLCDPGEPAIFSCACEMKLQGLSATWLKDNKPIGEELAARVKIVAKENVFTLSFDKAQAGDKGTYACRVTNANGEATTCSAQLEVHTLSAAERKEREASNLPVFMVKLKNAELIKDSTSSLMVHVKGNPNPDVKFMKDGAELKEDGRVIVNRDGGPNGSYEIIVKKVAAGDAGSYSVVASNSAGKEESVATVTVKDSKDVFALLKGHERKVAPGEEPTFTWFKSGQEFDPQDRFKVLFKDEEDTLALVFQHINPEDAGLYTCVASTSAGKVSCSAELSVEGGVQQLLKAPEPPKILAALGDTDTSAGGSAMLEFKMRGYPRPNIKWTKDGQLVGTDDRHKFVYPDPESVALIISKVAGEDVGTYKVTLSNDLGETSTEGKLALSGAPQFTEKIEDQKTGIDAPWKIAAKVTGEPELTWYLNGVPAVMDTRVKCVKLTPESFELQFAKTTADDNGNWAVIAKNAHGEMSQFFSFAALMMPKFEEKLKDMEANEGKQLVLKAKINCLPAPAVTWWKGETDVTKSSSFKVTKDPNGFDTLIIASANRSSAGEFTIKATNEMGTTSSKCTIKVNTKPSCDDLDDMEAFEGDLHTISIPCDGSPQPVIKWTKDGGELNFKDGHFTQTQTGGIYNLAIKDIKPEDAGTYQAEFTNRAGEKKVEAALNVHSLEELAIPKCMTDLKDKKAQKGGKTFFTMKIRGEPIPEVSWYLNDVLIENNERFQVSCKEAEYLYRLDIEGCCEDDYGKVKVVAKNENGESEKEASLEIQFPPEIQGAEEFKAGPGDVAMVTFKVRAFPGADAVWNIIKITGEGEEDFEETKIDSADKNFARFSIDVTPDDQWELHTLSIKDATMEDAGCYEITAANRVGATKRRGTLAIVTEPPTFPLGLADITTTLGSTETFETVVAGTPRPEVVWLRDGAELKKSKRTLFEEEICAEGGFRYKLSFRDIVLKDFGKVELKATNMVGEESTSAVFQIVQIEPTVTAEFPKMQERKEGAELVLSAKFDGSPPPTAVWLLEGEEIKADGERVIITEEESEDGKGMVTTLRITKVSDEDNGKYTLLIKNTAGETKADTMLDVMGKPKPPRIIKEIDPPELTLPGKKDLRLQCKIAGFPAPQIKWLRDGNEIKVRKGVLVSQDASGGGTLLIEKCQMSDAGVYSAVGVNDVGQAETCCTVTITQPMEEPKFSSLLRAAKAVEGSPIKLEGKMAGYPMPTIRWLKDEKEFSADGDRVKPFVQEDGTFGLIFATTVASDKGIYTAIAESEEGFARSNANVAIKSRMKEGVDKSAPSFGRPLGDVECDEGLKLRITTPIKGNPIPEFCWTKDGKPLSGDRVNSFSDGELGIRMFANVPKPPPRTKKMRIDSLNCDQNFSYSAIPNRNSDNCDSYELELIAYPSKDRPYKKVARSLTLPSRKRGETKELLNKNERIYRIVRRSSNSVVEAQLSEIGRLSRDLSTPTLINNNEQLSSENERSLSSTPFAQEQILSPNTKTKLLSKLTTLFRYCKVYR